MGKMHTQQSAAALAEHAKVTACDFNDRDANVPRRDLKINSRVGGDLQKNAAVWPPLMGRSGRVQKSRS